MEAKPSETVASRLERAQAESVPKIYFNGFINSLGLGDITAVLERNGQPVAVLNMSYTVAKSLSASLGTVVARLEELSNREMLTTSEIEEKLRQIEAEDAKHAETQ